MEEKSDDNRYFYENSKLNVSINFPKSWNGYYGINQVSNSKIYVYYLEDGKPSGKTTVLFTMEKGINTNEDKGFNVLRYFKKNNQFFAIYTQKRIDPIGELNMRNIKICLMTLMG